MASQKGKRPRRNFKLPIAAFTDKQSLRVYKHSNEKGFEYKRAVKVNVDGLNLKVIMTAPPRKA